MYPYNQSITIENHAIYELPPKTRHTISHVVSLSEEEEDD